MSARLEVRRRLQIYSPIRRRWVRCTTEERIRQEYVCQLVNNYGYSLDQMGEEVKVTGGAKADIVVWRTPQEKAEKKNPLIVVECKADYSPVTEADLTQGANYAGLTGAGFLVVRKNGPTKCWRVRHDITPKILDEVEDIPPAEGAEGRESETAFAKQQQSNPRWVKEVTDTLEFHEAKVKQYGPAMKGHGGGWRLQNTADELDESIGAVSRDIELARALRAYPELASTETKTGAWSDYMRKVEEGKIKRVHGAVRMGGEDAEEIEIDL